MFANLIQKHIKGSNPYNLIVTDKMYFIDGQTIDYSGFIVYTSVIHQLKNVYFVFIICTIRLLSSAGVVFQ